LNFIARVLRAHLGTILTGGRMPPLLARWKRAATVAAAILAASERGFQPRTSASMVRSCARVLHFPLLSLRHVV
jgi:hypothetical protein